MKISSTCILLLFFFMSCSLGNKNSLPDELYQIQEGYNNEDSSCYENVAIKLYKDSTYSYFAVNCYNYGKWYWDNNKFQLVLKPSQGNLTCDKMTLLLVGYPSTKYKVFRTRKISHLVLKDKKPRDYKGVFNRSKEDPFSPSMNTWRIKPSQQETEEQIKKRTIDYLHFLKSLYRYALDNKLAAMTRAWYPEPVQMYFSNGVRMAYNNEVIDWYQCFYNDDQAIEAYKLLSATMRKLKVPKTETIAERNIDIITQIEKIIQ